MQEWAELRLPIDSAELQAAAGQARGGMGLGAAEVFLEMRAQLSTAMPWAPMVRSGTLHGHLACALAQKYSCWFLRWPGWVLRTEHCS